MRQYRGLTKEGKSKWVYGWHTKVGDKCYIISEDACILRRTISDFNTVFGDVIANIIEVIPETVGQFTGLKDKNGKEIYEGDKAKMEYVWCSSGNYEMGDGDYEMGDEGYYIGEVVILPSMGVCLRNPLRTNADGETKKVNRYLNVRSYRSEVIGNIHQKPELLEIKQ